MLIEDERCLKIIFLKIYIFGYEYLVLYIYVFVNELLNFMEFL